MAGLSHSEFIFSGFFPRVLKEKHRVCNIAQNSQLPVVFFESAKRLLDTLNWIHKEYEITHLVVGKELTKAYEQLWRGSFDEVVTVLHSSTIKGEFLFLCELSPHSKNIDSIVQGLQSFGLGNKDILRFSVDVLSLPRNEVYRLLHND